MLNKAIAKSKRFLYELKDNIKSVDDGLIVKNDSASILDVIEIGFNKMEYYYTIKTKYSISLCLEENIGKVDLSVKRVYAEFSLYVTLIGYLDAVLARAQEIYARLAQEKNDYSIIIAGKISSATTLRQRILEDYLEDSHNKEENYIKTLLDKNPFYENIGELISMTQFSEKERFIIGGLIQAYMEGFKRNDNFNIDDIASFYERRQKTYIKYKNKCKEDLEEVKCLLQKENKPLLWVFNLL